MKKVLAGLLAFAMAAAAVGCGSVEEKSAGEENESAVENRAESMNGVEENDESAENSEQDADSEGSQDSGDSSSAEDNSGRTADSAKGFVNASNTIIEDDYISDDNVTYDADTLYLIMEKAVEQYNLIIDRDMQGYYDSTNIKKLVNSKGYDEVSENYEAFFDEMEEVEEEIYSMPVFLLDEMESTAKKYDEIEDRYENDEEEMVKALVEFVRETYANFAADDFAESPLLDEFSAFNYNFMDDSDEYNDDVPEDFQDNYANYHIVPDDTSIFGIEIDEYVSNQRGTFASLDLIAASGDWEYIFDECYAWVIDGEVGLYIQSFGIEENEVKGMTLAEIEEEVNRNYSSKTSNANAKSAFNAAAEYFADKECVGVSMQDVMKNGEFRMAEADETMGLNLALTAVPESEGDARLFTAMHDLDITSGFLYIGVLDAEQYEFFIQYMDEDGAIGQYPHPVAAENAGKVIWGKYFVSEEDLALEQRGV